MTATSSTTTTATMHHNSTCSLAVLGTGSDVGKSILAAGLCRILSNAGITTVVPFKGQNMSNNAYPALMSDDGTYGEIGIAQAIQARACRQIPRVEVSGCKCGCRRQMNPILLKSGGKRESDGAYLCSVFVLGKHVATEDFGALGQRTETLLDLVIDAYQRLQTQHGANVIILEGAGSCTELNLMDRDVVNIPLVRRIQSPWILVANIDPGGVFAQVVGTRACLTASDWDLCVGVVVNKLRGEAKYFEPGPQILREMVGKPIFVVPYLDNINIAEEDGMGLERKLDREHHGTIASATKNCDEKERIVVICYPHISMTDDLLPVEQDERFHIDWRRNYLPLYPPRAIVLPGSRQTRADMEWLAHSPWYKYVQDFAAQGGKVLGLCGGYQMMGREIVDPQGVESGSSTKTTAGLGLLAASTTLEPTKVIQGLQTAVVTCTGNGTKISVHGYEIHSGQTLVEPEESGSPLLRRQDGTTDGWIRGSLAGTYFHGVLESQQFRSWFFLPVDKRNESDAQTTTPQIDPLDRLAEHLIAHGLDFETLSSMMGIPTSFTKPQECN
eukprot:scaffold162_cov176-Amphora_coffeaeformis.AAC.15